MTLEDLRESSRSKADEEQTGFIGTEALDRFINQGCRLIYGKLVQKFENFFIVPGTALNSGLFSTVSGTQGYSLPATLLKLIRVEYRQSTSTNDDDWIKIEPLNIANDPADNLDPFYDLRGSPFGYFIAGDRLFLRPTPTQVYSVRLWFIPRFTALSAVSDTPGFPEEYHELAAEYAAAQCLRKSGEPIWKESMDLFNLELQNMIETAEIRDQQPEQMVITEWQDYGGWGV
jgi:hypothetical protein